MIQHLHGQKSKRISVSWKNLEEKTTTEKLTKRIFTQSTKTSHKPVKLRTSVVKTEAMSAAFLRPYHLSPIWKAFKETHGNWQGPFKTQDIRFGWKSRYHDLGSESDDGVVVNYGKLCASISTLPAVQVTYKVGDTTGDFLRQSQRSAKIPRCVRSRFSPTAAIGV